MISQIHESTNIWFSILIFSSEMQKNLLHDCKFDYFSQVLLLLFVFWATVHYVISSIFTDKLCKTGSWIWEITPWTIFYRSPNSKSLFSFKSLKTYESFTSQHICEWLHEALIYCTFSKSANAKILSSFLFIILCRHIHLALPPLTVAQWSQNISGVFFFLNIYASVFLRCSLHIK